MDPLEFKPIEPEVRKKILDYIKSRIDEADPVKLREAVLSMGWVEDAEELAEPLMVLVTEGKPEVALAALEGLVQLGIRESEKPLASHIVELFKKNDPAYSQVREECIRVMGKVGTKHCVGFLAAIMQRPKPVTARDKEAAVEALVSLAERRVQGISGLLEKLRPLAGDKIVRKAIHCALKEINLQRWEERGYLTIEAEFDSQEESDI